jgi:hypothetical protein
MLGVGVGRTRLIRPNRSEPPRSERFLCLFPQIRVEISQIRSDRIGSRFSKKIYMRIPNLPRFYPLFHLPWTNPRSVWEVFSISSSRPSPTSHDFDFELEAARPSPSRPPYFRPASHSQSLDLSLSMKGNKMSWSCFFFFWCSWSWTGGWVVGFALCRSFWWFVFKNFFNETWAGTHIIWAHFKKYIYIYLFASTYIRS